MHKIGTFCLNGNAPASLDLLYSHRGVHEGALSHLLLHEARRREAALLANLAPLAGGAGVGGEGGEGGEWRLWPPPADAGPGLLLVAAHAAVLYKQMTGGAERGARLLPAAALRLGCDGAASSSAGLWAPLPAVGGPSAASESTLRGAALLCLLTRFPAPAAALEAHAAAWTACEVSGDRALKACAPSLHRAPSLASSRPHTCSRTFSHLPQADARDPLPPRRPR